MEEESVNEKAFLLTWLGLGGVIFVQGIALASSGICYLIYLLHFIFIWVNPILNLLLK